MLLSMITPVSWLERVPTYKGQIEALGQEIATYGFLGYPLLQLCDIAVFRGQEVPVGRDQVAHLEFAREVVRRFNYLYGQGEEILVEPKAMLVEGGAEVPGTDGRKMSKSYGNTILLADDEAETTKKVRGMITRSAQGAPQRSGAARNLPGFRVVEAGEPATRAGSRARLPLGSAGLRARQNRFGAAARRIPQTGPGAARSLRKRSGAGGAHS